MAVAERMPAMPFERPHELEIAPLYLSLQHSQPVCRVRTPAGDPAWLVLGYDNVRAALANPDLGRAHPDPDRAARFSDAAVMGRPIGNPETERADHTRMRLVMNRSFSLRRMEAMRPRVQALVDELLDRMASGTPPADLHEAFSFPLPALVICELLGVPYEDREDFRRWSDRTLDMSDRAASFVAQEQLYGYMRELIERKRRQPAEDVVSDMIHAADVEGLLEERELVEFAAGLLFAGHETTVTQIDLGMLLLLTNPDQRALLQRDPSLAPRVAEEVLRRAPTSRTGVVVRYAASDVELGGVTIPSGDLLLIGISAANRDDRAFEAPDRFDITRERRAHLGFGYGRHFCVGAPLARVELQCVFGTLFQRFPTLDLAVPFEAIRERTDLLTGGVEELPVTW